MKIVNGNNMIKPFDISSLWLENNLCIFFGDTGVGKSIFAVQMALDVIKKTGEPVLYFDLELSEREFMHRFTSDYLGELFYRVAPNPKEWVLLNTKTVIDLIIKTYKERHFKYFVVDSMIYLSDHGYDYNRAKRLILKFKSVVDEFPEISIMLVGHTKKRNDSHPISDDDLAGSKVLINSVESVFAITPSVKGGNVVYLKQLKAPDGRLVYGDNNVLQYQLKRENNVLIFKQMGTTAESEHLFNHKNLFNDKNRAVRRKIKGTV